MGLLASKNKYYREEARIRLKGIKREWTSEVLRAREDFVYFCEYLTRNKDPQIILQPHHLEWVEAIFTGKDTKVLHGMGGENLNILSPRGSSKSTVIRLLVAWLIGYHVTKKRLLRILYISANKAIALGGSATIKKTIESEEYQEIFPEIKQGSKWSDQHWAIDTQHANIPVLGEDYFTLLASGITGTIISKRAHLVIYDDLIKSSEDIDNPDVRNKIVKNHGELVVPCIFEGGRIIGVGTRYRGDDCHAKAFIPEKKWEVIEQKALIEDPETGELKSYWEEMWSTENLHEKLEEIGTLAFSYQYQNTVVTLSEIGIPEDSIIYEPVPKHFDKYGLGVDLAVSEKTQACYTAMVLVGVKDSTYYVLDMRRGKWRGNIDKLDKILELYGEWAELDKSFRIYVENVAYQGSLEGDFKNYVYDDLQEYGLTCRGMTLKGDKVTHFTSLTGLFANKRVRFNHSKDVSPLVLELVGFQTTAENDDCMDALCLAIHGIGFKTRVEIV